MLALSSGVGVGRGPGRGVDVRRGGVGGRRAGGGADAVVCGGGAGAADIDGRDGDGAGADRALASSPPSLRGRRSVARTLARRPPKPKMPRVALEMISMSTLSRLTPKRC